MKKKRFKLQNVVKRMIAMLTIVSMTVTGFGMMDSSAFNGVLSGDGTLSGDSELSGDAFEDDNFIVENIANGMVSASSTEDIFSCILETGDDAVEYAKKSYKRIKGAKFKSVYAQYYELNHSKDTIKTVNYNGAEFISHYLYEKKILLLGSCAETAMTIMSEYFNYKGFCKIKNETKNPRSIEIWKKVFLEYVDIAMKEGYLKSDGKGGTKPGYAKLAEIFYNRYGKFAKGEVFRGDTEKMKRKIKTSLSVYNKPIIGDFYTSSGSGHSMVIVGIYMVTVRYQLDGKTYSYDMDFYVVNDGIRTCDSGNFRIQYIRTTYLGNIENVTF